MKVASIPIFYACDDNFAKYMVLSLASMMKTSSKDKRYRIHILNTTISEKTKNIIYDMKAENFEISFDDVSPYLEKIAERLPLRHYYTKTTYFRLFIPDMFPEYDKAIYIDADTVVRTDIAKLYDTDIKDNLVGACKEQAMEQMDVFGQYCEEVVGISRHAFFNAGLLLINCKEFRRRNSLDRFFKLLSEYDFVVTQDEDYLNVICKDYVHFLDQRWNTEVTEGITYPYSVKEEANIVHFIMANKPWHNEASVEGDIFWEAAEGTPVEKLLKEELQNYTDEQRAKDAESGRSLVQMAEKEIQRGDNYRRRLLSKMAPDRVLVLNKIEEYEKDGKFDIDTEIDPPTKPLYPDDIDYLRTSLKAKLGTAIAYMKAKKFLNYIIKHKLMIIREIKGLENLSEIDSGAIITSNHFNPFDTFAIHKAYLESGHKKRKLYRVIREGNYTSFDGFYGYLMKHFYTLPLSSIPRTMHKFNKATDKLLSDGHFVLVYPEQSLWWNYRKPKPLKPGAFSFAVKNNVPVIPCFITMKDSGTLGNDGYPIQEYTIHIEKPIYPSKELYHKDAVEDMMNKNSEVWKKIYEREYSIPLEYTTIL